MFRLYDTDTLRAKTSANNNDVNKFPEDGLLKSTLQQSVQQTPKDNQISDLISFLDNLIPPQLKDSNEANTQDSNEICTVQSPVVTFINQIKQMSLEQERLKKELELLKNPEQQWKNHLLQQLLDEDENW